ncbi:YqiA/YcfP family alpha/beta fold hydrolase [Hydrogenophaga sp.]|uniref:YqiA/YcfP family alpha/beta fold hydrolase n=1 Tax=Hydrogenophaga sp. TaxID=1904254 RepID=UPI00271AFA8B|nr:YqiA/YcfP family alpha/beta fold hydrolase [Hydrogenophaga sp.]MDO8904151.1 YqiA/YcfP family alpha/beta fold hydrolase [Hydrogenophaga sp.]
MSPHTSGTTHLLYLHGFRSSPLSMKATKVANRVSAEHPDVVWWCPQLPPSPREAMALVMQGTALWPRQSMAVVGSSLGGFYARWFALQTGCWAALLNPAVFPARDLARHIGEHATWQNPEERFFFQPGYIDELQRLEADIHHLAAAPATRQGRQFAVIATGDEVLNWREMHAFCAGSAIRLIEGSDHAISDFDEHIDALFDFLNLVRPGQTRPEVSAHSV